MDKKKKAMTQSRISHQLDSAYHTVSMIRKSFTEESKLAKQRSLDARD